MKRLVLTVILVMAAMFSVSAADLVFHFDFKCPTNQIMI